jgi:GNAT superfamily N-acetyltransferase
VLVSEVLDWRVWKPLRLEALADTPIGFGELYADAVAQADHEWELRWRRQTGIKVMALERDVPLGIAGGFPADDGRKVLFSVYVRPAARGRGVLEALVDRVEAWAAPDPLHLDVHVDNAPARSAYLRLGFVENGMITPGGGIDGRDLVGMVRPPGAPPLQGGAASR